MGDKEAKSSAPPSPPAEDNTAQAEPSSKVKPDEPTGPEPESQETAEPSEPAEEPAPVEEPQEPQTAEVETSAPATPVKDQEDGADATPEPVAQDDAAKSPPDSTPDSAPTPPTPPPKPAAPALRRPKPPTRGILKPPPPPAKPTLGNRLRDMVVGVTGEVPGPSSRSGSDAMNAAVGTFNAISGRLGLFNRFAPKEEPQHRQQPHALPRRSTSLASDGSSTSPVHSVASPDRHTLPLKRATFVLPSISITYPISSQNEPWSTKVVEDRERVESRQRMLLSTASGGEYWTSIRLIKLYESACRGREEKPRLGVIRALQALPSSPKPRTVHLVLHDAPHSGYPAPYPLEHPLTRYAAEALSDLLTVEWSLSDLRLERGILETEEALKPILHALLVSGSLPSLSLSGNKKIKAGGWRLVSVFLKRARSLRFLDLSETTWDRKGIEYLVQALNSQGHTVNDGSNDSADGDSADAENGGNAYGPFLPAAPLLKDTEANNLPPAVETLRMDNCTWRSGTLEALAHGVRTSDLKHISLRQNRIGPLGAVSLAVMIRDYPDTTSAVNSLSPLSSASSPDSAVYAHYSPRVRRGVASPNHNDDGNLPPIPVVKSSATGGVTSRVLPEGYKPPPPPKHPLVMSGGGYSAMQDGAGFAMSAVPSESKMSGPELGGASLALQRSVRALAGVERIGHLLTLDLKDNDIGKGVTYISQVLKRNRTLKVLNLSENKIDPVGLVSLAEALKYNSTLETLDISSNMCCGPESISALRMSFTVNNSLKRLFLMDTGLTTEGAIDLAEFIPENRSLLHLDVTRNPAIDTAGILALSSGLKSNRFIRCLDVSIPPNVPNLAELSQSILQSCIRNTENAASALKETKPARAATEALWRPIKKSALVRQVKEADAARAQKEREQVVRSVQGVAREYVYRLSPGDVVAAAEDTIKGLQAWYANPAWEGPQVPREDFRALIERGRALTERIAEMVTQGADAEYLEKLLELNDLLTSLVHNAKSFVQPPRILLPSQIAFAPPAAPVVTTTQSGLMPRTRRHQRSTSLEILSPNFSIGDSDAESDAEELDSSTLATPPARLGAAAEDKKRLAPRINIDGSSRTPSPGNNDADAAAERLVDAELAQGHGASSPVERASRQWVEEEAEIFRKGTRLGVVNSDSEDEHPSLAAGAKREELTGEQLRQEIMETEVPRSPPRQVLELEESSDDDETLAQVQVKAKPKKNGK